ncbi:MAG: hypothetical protein ACREJW_00520 [Candidatus Methylomirabilales bacterium]
MPRNQGDRLVAAAPFTPAGTGNSSCRAPARIVDAGQWFDKATKDINRPPWWRGGPGAEEPTADTLEKISQPFKPDPFGLPANVCKPPTMTPEEEEYIRQWEQWCNANPGMCA